MPALKNSQSGFSLVELLVAVVILAIGLLGLAELQVSAMKANSQTATSTAATALAQMVVEGVAAMDADDAIFNGPSTGNLWETGTFTVEGAGTYNVTYDVLEVNPDPSDLTVKVSNLYEIRIKVESTQDLLHVLGNKKRTVETTTFKRAI